MDSLIPNTQSQIHQRNSELATGSSSTLQASSSVELEGAETPLSLDFHPENGNGTMWAESELTVLIIFQMILIIILCILGTCINSLVFWVFNRRPALRSLSNRFVLSLVTANLFISSIITPLILLGTVLHHYLPISCIPGLISTMADSVVFIAIFSVLLIATDRYFAVTSPLHYSMTITRSRSQVLIFISWISGILLSLPHLLISSFLGEESDSEQNGHLVSAALQLSLGFLFPFIGLCWLYWRMYTAAHRNSERTRKHSISGELLTVLDGSTSVIPQGIDFLTHYMNPFSKTPMVGSIVPSGSTTATGVVVMTTKKTPRRSSNGSSSSLLFREEGRAIKTAFLVLASFLLCWTPHFTLILVTEVGTEGGTKGRLSKYSYGNWDQFISLIGLLLSSLLHPFIYVFRNKMACKELTKLLCGFLVEQKRKEDLFKYGHNNNHISRPLTSGSPDPVPLHTPPTILPKSPRRSSMKSLTPQSSVTSNSTHVNLTTHGSSSSSSTDSPLMLIGSEVHLNKPPFLRSLTLPEQPRVKFPPNLVRQKSHVQRTVSAGPGGETHRPLGRREMDSGICQSPAEGRRSMFVRQDSVGSNLSSDSVLMICGDDGLSTADIHLCSNSHKIRYNRLHYPSRLEENHQFSSRDSVEDWNGGEYERIYSSIKPWNHSTQIPVHPSTLAYKDSDSSDKSREGRRGNPGISSWKRQSLEHRHQMTTFIVPTQSNVDSESEAHWHLDKFPRPSSKSSDFPMLLQTAI